MERSEHPPEYLEGLRLFNSGQYWHCHEALEEIWLDCNGIDRDYYQGLIQVSAACFHIVRQNWSGANKLLHSATKNLVSAHPDYRGLDVSDLMDVIERLLDEVHACQNQGKQAFDRSLIPVLSLAGGPDLTKPPDEL